MAKVFEARNCSLSQSGLLVNGTSAGVANARGYLLALAPAPWPWGDGVVEVPRWAFMAIVALVVIPAAYLFVRRALHSFQERD